MKRLFTESQKHFSNVNMQCCISVADNLRRPQSASSSVSARVLEHTELCVINLITCVVHGEESLLHEEMLEVLVIHWDFSHHVPRHIPREPPGRAVIEAVRVFVSDHLMNAEAAQLVASWWVL